MAYLFNDSVKITGNPVRTINENQSQFGEVKSVTRTPIIELNSSYGTSILRDIIKNVGSGTVTSGNGKIVLSTGATINSKAHLDSAEIGRYVPGYSAELGIGIRVPTLPTGNKYALWGGLGSNEENGFYFGVDSTGLFVARRVGGTEAERVYQSDFNIDKFDGTGPSKFVLDTTIGNIYQIEFTWYGYGQILYGINAIVPDGDNPDVRGFMQQFIPCHSMKVEGDVSTYSPNLLIHTEASNGADAEDFIINVGGRQYSIVGKYLPKYRFVGDFTTNVGTSTVVAPLISFRRKANFGDRSVKLEGFDTIATTEPCIVEVRINPTLTGESFSTPTNHISTETALESDTSATAITGGHVVWQQMVSAGANKNTGALASSSVDFDIPNGSIVSLTARTLSGTGTISAQFRLREEW